MMNINFIALTLFVFITTFTPGPNNISCASSGLRFGYRRTLPYLAGIGSGFFLLMLACMSFATLLGEWLQHYEHIIRIAGSLYITWLAWKSLGISYTDEDSGPVSVSSFQNGFWLQMVNPKAILYGLTIFSTFLMPVNGEIGILIFLSLLFTLVTFSAISLWALSGAWIRGNLKSNKLQKILNYLLSAALFAIAVDLTGFLS